MTCLQLAIKMHENCILDFKQAIELCYKQFGYNYQVEMLELAECKILCQFGCDLNIPTAADFVKILVEMYDFGGLQLTDVVPHIYQSCYTPAISETHTQMAIGTAAILFQAFCDN